MAPVPFREENTLDVPVISRSAKRTVIEEVNGNRVVKEAGPNNDFVATAALFWSGTRVTMNKKIGRGFTSLERALHHLEVTIMWCRPGGLIMILTDGAAIMRGWNCIVEWSQRDFEGLMKCWSGWPGTYRLIQEERSVERKMGTKEDNPKFWKQRDRMCECAGADREL
jgi:hypothetical protein